MLDKALTLVDGTLTGATLNEAVGRVSEMDSPRGKWRFTATHTPQQKWYLRQVRRDGAALSNTVLSELTTLG